MLILALLSACGPVLDDGTVGDSNAPADSGELADGELLPPIIDGDPDDFYADGQVQQVALELSEASISALRDDPRTWTEAVFVYGGERYGPVGVHIKGQSSFRSIDEKPSLKVKFSEYQEDGRFLGMRRLVFNNMVSDPSMVRERVAFRFCRERGVPAPRANHTTLAINGVDYGLYENVENTDEELLGGWFDDAEGSMWEIYDGDFQEEFINGFELEEGEDDRTQIEALAEAMATVEGPSRMREFVHSEAWFRYFATMAWMGNLDGYPFSEPGDDAHLYKNPTDGLFHFIPHGLDETFLDDASVEYVMHGILATACLGDAACKATWRAALVEAIADAESTDLRGWVDTYAAEIDAYGDADPRSEYSPVETDEARAYVKEFMELRSPDLKEQLTWD